MELLQELVHYKSLNIEKNCKEDIILFIRLWCLWRDSQFFSMPACAANNRKTAITCCSINFVCLNNCLSLNLQSMANKSKTMVFWKLVCTDFVTLSPKKSARKAEEFLQNKRCTRGELTSFGSRVPFES